MLDIWGSTIGTAVEWLVLMLSSCSLLESTDTGVVMFVVAVVVVIAVVVADAAAT